MISPLLKEAVFQMGDSGRHAGAFAVMAQRHEDARYHQLSSTVATLRRGQNQWALAYFEDQLAQHPSTILRKQGEEWGEYARQVASLISNGSGKTFDFLHGVFDQHVRVGARRAQGYTPRTA